MTLARNVSTFVGCDADPCDAHVVIFGAPFDSTTSFRPGARFGPSAIRAESMGLETYSPYLDADLADCRVADIGDLDLPFGSAVRALEMIEEAAAEVIAARAVPLMLGGEHLVTLGAVRAAVKRWPGLHVVHFDAHADLRDTYMGEANSHATVMRRVHELVGDGRVHQFCIRSGEREEFAFAAAHTDMTRYDTAGAAELAGRLASEGVPVYLTIDLDCLDPSVLPGTGTPEAGGVTFDELRRAVAAVCGARVVAADAVELAPHIDATGASTAVACKLVREMLIGMRR